MIKFLLQACPESVKVLDRRNNLALHIAVQFDASYLVIFTILKLHEVAASTPNGPGSYPLHKAAYFNSSFDVLELLLGSYPAAAGIKDSHGNLPLHLSFLIAGGPPDEKKLRLWLGSYPGALSIKNNQGMTPLTMFNRPEAIYIEDYM